MYKLFIFLLFPENSSSFELVYLVLVLRTDLFIDILVAHLTFLFFYALSYVRGIRLFHLF